ncbi:MAG TPA: peptidoglycan-associated lipoprotein Pal [Anaerolineae bacterium]|nr:peptidoglycan-associated lipoprotein Pal [Anaerolineae bacterium]
MNKKLIGSVLLAALLAACSSKQVKEEPKAAVEDKSPKTTQQAAKTEAPTTTAVTETAVGVNPLKDPNNILSKRSIYFDFDKDEVKQEFRPLVEAHAKYLTQNPDARVALQGNADERGSREYNLALGQRRAVAVKKVLNVLGASDKQIETVSYGEEKPRCTDRAEACWSQNRRADIVYAGEE